MAQEATSAGSLSYTPIAEETSSSADDDRQASITVARADSFRDLADAERSVPEPAGDPLGEFSITGELSESVSYRVRSRGSEWGAWTKGGEGFSGQSPIAAVQFKLSDDLADQYSVVYRVHVADGDWLGWAADGETAGYDEADSFADGIDMALVSKSELELSSELAAQAAASYMGPEDDASHDGDKSEAVENDGLNVTGDGSVDEQNTESDQQGEVDSDGGTASLLSARPMLLMSATQQVGSAAQATRPGVSYQAHVQDAGWQDEVSNGATSGTTGRSLRIEGVKFTVAGIDGGIEYRAHVQDVGWQSWVQNGSLGGTVGKSLRVEALELRLTGNAASHYDVYYRVHVSDIGWMGWAKKR